MFKCANAVFALATLSAVLVADERRSLQLRPTPSPLVIDGSIEPAWFAADSTAEFFQFRPYFGKEPSRRTVARLLTTPEAMYCLIVAYDKRDNIQTNTGLLDDGGGDVVSLMIDTFGDRRTAYKFAVSASGVRSDARMLDDARNRDYSWDGVWFADAKVFDWGYVVEMEIPYRSIQYDERLAEWGLDFDRWCPERTEDLYWCTYEENEGQRISKFGRLSFTEVRPSAKGSNLEVYPVGLTKATYLREGVYTNRPTAGVDIFYNPSPQLTFQFTANPDFAQIEADPFDFNISRYESHFDERRPFFTQGNEVFTASGRQNNTGFYQPLELFYSRRIGKKLSDGSEVPLIVGTKAFGRIDDWEYGGFVSMTDDQDYRPDGVTMREQRAVFGAARIKRQVFENSSVGLFAVVKQDRTNRNAVVDIDGAFRGSSWQLSYQIARSDDDGRGGFGGSAGFTQFTDSYLAFARTRLIGEDFSVDQVGFVPWKGTKEFTAIGGPRWYFPEGTMSSILLYAGPSFYYEKVDRYTDIAGVLGYNMQFRANWGFEITFVGGRSKDLNIAYSSRSLSLSSWFNTTPKWNFNAWGEVARTYNFDRHWLATYASIGTSINWKALNTMSIGTSGNLYVEGNPRGTVEDATVNARPYVSLTPMNNVNIRIYVDNVYVKSSDKLERMIAGLLFSYNFLPKSWVYLAINEVRDRTAEFDASGMLLRKRMHVADRAAVLKLKYLYYM